MTSEKPKKSKPANKWETLGLVLVQLTALLGVFILAAIYDGEFIWVACILAGGVLGINVNRIWKR